MTPDQADALEEQRKDEAELQQAGWNTEPTDAELEQMFVGLLERGEPCRLPALGDNPTDEQVEQYWRWNAAWLRAYAKRYPLPSHKAIAECKRRDPDFLGGLGSTARRERGDVAAECAESHEQHWLQAHGLR